MKFNNPTKYNWMMKWAHPYGSTAANRTAGALPRAAGKFACVLVILFGICGVAVAQDLDCSALLAELAHDWGPDTDPGTVFEGYTPRNPGIFSAVGAQVQMYIPNYWQDHPHPEAPHDTPEVIAEAIRKTTEQLNPYLRPMPICVVLSPSIAGQATEDWDWHTLADASRLSGVCAVAINLPGALPADDDSGFRVGRQSASELQATVAHEIYHCYQERHFSDQATGRLYAPATWWVESSAEFIANLIYPCNMNTRMFARGYDPGTRLFDQEISYGNVVFFQHLSEKFGFDIGGLKAYSLAMATQPGISRQQEALAARPGIARQFHSFAQAFTDQSMAACIAPNLNQGDIPVTRVNGDQRIPLSVRPFAVGRHKIVLAEGATYRVSAKPHSGRATGGLDDPDIISYRDADAPGRWAMGGVPEFTIKTGCGETLSYIFLTTSASANDAPFNVDIVVEKLERSSCRCQRIALEEDEAECPVGSWRMTNDSMRTIYFGGPAKHGELSITGDVILNLRRDGSLTKSYRDARYHYRKVEVYDRITKEEINTVDLFSGDVDGCYNILQSRLGPDYLTAMEVEDGVSRRTTGHREGRTIDQSKDGQMWNWWPRSKRSKTRFQCKNDTLTLGNRVYERIPAEGR